MSRGLQSPGGYGNELPNALLKIEHPGKAAFKVAAELHSQNDFGNVGALIVGDFVFHAEIAPTMPMITEDLAKPVMAGGVADTLSEGTTDLLRANWRLHVSH